jgi:hypothetical protein
MTLAAGMPRRKSNTSRQQAIGLMTQRRHCHGYYAEQKNNAGIYASPYMALRQKLCRLLPLRYRQGVHLSCGGLPVPLPAAELFRPNKKPVSKPKVGSKTVKKYDSPKPLTEGCWKPSLPNSKMTH